MDNNTYTLVSTALLGVIALLLLFVIARLVRVERALKSRPEEQPPPESPSVDGAIAAAISEPLQASAEPMPETDSGDAPFEKDGRWWYRQGDELLVYNEQTESWVLPDEPREIEPHPLDEARGWDARPQESTTPEEATAAPIAEPVSAPAPITEVETGVVTGTADDPLETPVVETPVVETPAATEPAEVPVETATGGTHWKCPACGVINGSTATSCRMCFAARP